MKIALLLKNPFLQRQRKRLDVSTRRNVATWNLCRRRSSSTSQRLTAVSLLSGFLNGGEGWYVMPSPSRMSRVRSIRTGFSRKWRARSRLTTGAMPAGDTTLSSSIQKMGRMGIVSCSRMMRQHFSSSTTVSLLFCHQ